MSLGNGHRGGRLYQFLALLLTWGAMATAYAPFIAEGMRGGLAEETVVTSDPATSAPSAAGEAEPADVSAEPAPESSTEGEGEGDFFSLPAVVRCPLIFGLAILIPFLAVTESPMGLIIFLIGLWTAWGTNKRGELHVSGPHALGAAFAPAHADPMPPSA